MDHTLHSIRIIFHHHINQRRNSNILDRTYIFFPVPKYHLQFFKNNLYLRCISSIVSHKLLLHKYFCIEHTTLNTLCFCSCEHVNHISLNCTTTIFYDIGISVYHHFATSRNDAPICRNGPSLLWYCSGRCDAATTNTISSIVRDFEIA